MRCIITHSQREGTFAHTGTPCLLLRRICMQSCALTHMRCLQAEKLLRISLQTACRSLCPLHLKYMLHMLARTVLNCLHGMVLADSSRLPTLSSCSKSAGFAHVIYLLSHCCGLCRHKMSVAYTQVLMTMESFALLAVWSSAMMAFGFSHSWKPESSDHQAVQGSS